MIDFDRALEQSSRNYWGLSQVGDCQRKRTFIEHPDYEPEIFDANTIRIFQFGHKVEELLAEEIRQRGHELTDQQAKVEWCNRIGHIDGVIDGDILWECKSMNSSAFNGWPKVPGLINAGVYQKYPHYYAQIQAYMNGMGLSRALFTGLNKDNSVIYQEIIPYDDYESLRLYKDIHIVNRYCENQELHPIPDWVTWHCRYCNYKKVCKEG